MFSVMSSGETLMVSFNVNLVSIYDSNLYALALVY